MASTPASVGNFSRNAFPRSEYSLRTALLGSIFLALLIATLVAGTVSVLHGRHQVAVELGTALEVGRQNARELIAGASPGRPVTAEDLISPFKGDRHLQAVLLDGSGRQVAISNGEPEAERVPHWFLDALDPLLAPVRLDAGSGRTLELRSTAPDEIDEKWTYFKDGVLFLGVFSTLVFLVVFVSLVRPLRALRRLSDAFAQVGQGHYDVAVGQASTSELRRLNDGFNAMVGRLGEAQARNLQLEEQLIALQEEERADLAGDLHDEIGPYLFAASMDASAIVRLAREGKAEAVVEPAQAIRGSVEHIQRHVRDMLRRLKPTQAVELGLEPALRELVAFWEVRRPDIAFALDVQLEDDTLGDDQRVGLYRVTQEAVANAVRHGRPTRISIGLALDAQNEIVLEIGDDGAAVGPTDHSPSSGFGLPGMRQRMAALGGTLSAGPRSGAAGWAVTAQAPLRPA